MSFTSLVNGDYDGVESSASGSGELHEVLDDDKDMRPLLLPLVLTASLIIVTCTAMFVGLICYW